MDRIKADKMHKIAMAVITKSNLNICPPYTRRYPSPALLDKYSPIITPTHAIPKLIFRVATKFGRVAGNMSFENIWNLFAPIVCINMIFSFGISRYPFNKFIVVMTTQINIPIVTIALVPTPTQMIIKGPRDIFGSEFKTTKYGSKTFRSGVIR